MSELREVFFLIGRQDAVLWSDVSRSPMALPDSRGRWEAIWRHRHELEWLVHSHPIGPHAFSEEDRTTMDALDVALGKPQRYAVLSPQGLVVRNGDAPVELPFWVELMRAASGMPPTS